MDEHWKIIEGWPEYEVSSFGRFRRRSSGRLLKPILQSKGYTHVCLYRDKKPYQFRSHRLVAEAFCPGKSEVKNQVNHKDNDRSNNRADNLEWCSAKENSAHSVRCNRKARGENHGCAKLSEPEVVEILSLVERGFKRKWIAQDFCVSPSTISRIALRKNWRHLGEPND